MEEEYHITHHIRDKKLQQHLPHAGVYLVDEGNIPKHLFRMENMLKYT